MSKMLIQHKATADMIASPDWAKYTEGPDWVSYKRKDASGHVCMKSEGIIPLTVIEVHLYCRINPLYLDSSVC